MTEMRAIVLAAGEGLSLDGFNKALIRHPKTGERILEQYLRHLSTLRPGIEVTVVVGFRAIELLHRWPALRFVHNPNWRLTGNAYSLALALDDRPALVLSADFFLEEGVLARVLEGPADAVLCAHRGNRTLSATNLEVRADGSIAAVYQGAVRSDRDPEAPGIFKVTSPALVRAWKRRCLEYPNLFALQNLPLEAADPGVFAVDVGGLVLDEINTPQDYLNLMERP
jgi:choline kinase